MASGDPITPVKRVKTAYIMWENGQYHNAEAGFCKILQKSKIRLIGFVMAFVRFLDRRFKIVKFLLFGIISKTSRGHLSKSPWPN
jgi:hypothetical protein